MYFIVKDMHPLDTIDDKGFRHMIHTFEPKYTPPSRKTISTKHLPQLYDSAIGGEMWITISTIRPILHKLLESSFIPSSDDYQQVKTFKDVLLTDLQDF